MTAELQQQNVENGKQKRSALSLPGRWRTYCRSPKALPRCSVLTPGKGAGANLLSLFCFCPCSCRGCDCPLCLLAISLLLPCCTGWFTCDEHTFLLVCCAWARFCPVLRAASLHWAAAQQMRFVFSPLWPLIPYYTSSLEASAYRQEKR